MLPMLQRKQWLSLSVFVVAGAIFILTPWFSPTVFECDRAAKPSGKCWVKNLVGIPLREIPLNFVEGVEQRFSNRGRFSSNQLVIHTKTGEIHFNAAQTDAPMYVSGQIQAFLNQPEQRYLKAVQDERLFGFFWGIGFWVVGGLVLVLMILFPSEQ
jgi:hypothetical protein